MNIKSGYCGITMDHKFPFIAVTPLCFRMSMTLWTLTYSTLLHVSDTGTCTQLSICVTLFVLIVFLSYQYIFFSYIAKIINQAFLLVNWNCSDAYVYLILRS